MAKPGRTVEHKQAEVYDLQAEPGTDASQLLAHIPMPSYYAGPQPVKSQSSHPAMFHHIQSFYFKSINDMKSKGKKVAEDRKETVHAATELEFGIPLENSSRDKANTCNPDTNSREQGRD